MVGPEIDDDEVEPEIEDDEVDLEVSVTAALGTLENFVVATTPAKRPQQNDNMAMSETAKIAT